MNGKYLYEVFDYCEEHKLPDLTIALAQMSHEIPIPDGTTFGEVCQFIGKNYNALVDAYAKKDVEYFASVVNSLTKETAEA